MIDNILHYFLDNILSIITIIGGIFMYVIHERKLKKQAKALNDLQISYYQHIENQKLKADFKAEIIHEPRRRPHLRLYNIGNADAKNIRIKFTEEDQYDINPIDYPWESINLVNAESYYDYILDPNNDIPRDVIFEITWDDEYSKNRQKSLSIQL